MSVIYFVICVALVACSADFNSAVIGDAAVTETISESPEKAGNSKPTEGEQYLHKIWVVNEWEGGAYKYPVTFFITRIENGKLEGQISTMQVEGPEFFYYRSEPSIYLGELKGTFDGDNAKCHFGSDYGDKGNISLSFINHNEISANIEYTDKGEAHADLPLDGNYVFRPYNLSDMKNYDINKTRSIAVDLNSWGNIYFTTLLYLGNKPHPMAYLTNEYGDILYKFNAPFQTGTSIIDVNIEDINGDGLKDIYLVSGFIDYETWEIVPVDPPIEWSFLQRKDGLFYDSSLNIH
ncbi:MAG: hypothetical protein LBV08_10805 [Clostridiales bacterium]|jgi:hypothetical protein|nr:hypothetical protein [Clostridiales bacterium]